ncbi:MAG TPA: hypothetical protein VFB14_17740 [Bryobacteraceae bacterium]|jgi:hypothetical protein|nr:hypothetical protein [Bryobacteraceae bacterium]
MKHSSLSAEQRKSILVMLVSLSACFVIASPNLIWGVSSVAGVLTSGLSCYALLLFVLHLKGLELQWPATIRRWQALVLLCVAALSAWVLVFLHANPFAQKVAAFAPACSLAGLILGPWRGLMPVSKTTREKQRPKEEEKLR